MYQSQRKVACLSLKKKFDPRLSQTKRELHDFGDPELRKEIDQLLKQEEDFQRTKRQHYKANPLRIKDLAAIKKRLVGAMQRLMQPQPMTESQAHQVGHAYRLASGTMKGEEMYQKINRLAERQRQVAWMKDEMSCFRYNSEELECTLKEMKNEREGLKLKKQTEKGLIRRYCRIKPANEKDQRCYKLFKEDPDLINVQVIKELSNSTYLSPLTLRFDQIFQQSASQAQVFEAFEQSIEVALNGKPFCLFAYGQTCSGKTHTIFGGEGDDQGICPRIIRKVFAVQNEESQAKPSLMIGVEEITKDGRMDMVTQKANKFGNQKFLHLNSEQQVIAAVKHYSDLRDTCETSANQNSSRSHLIITFKTVKQIDGKQTQGRISIVDLAGSQRPGTAQDKQETTFINNSLLALRTRIKQLANDYVVPVSSQPLIQALDLYLNKDSSITSTIINISPLKTNASETKRSIEFAQEIGKARKIAVKSKKPKQL